MILQDNFESGNLNNWTVLENCSIVNSPTKSGTNACKTVTQDAGGSYYALLRKSGLNTPAIYCRIYFMLPALQANGTNLCLITFQDSGYGHRTRVGISTNGGRQFLLESNSKRP